MVPGNQITCRPAYRSIAPNVPQECQIKEHYDMRASALIRQLFEKKVTRQAIVEQIAATPESYREFFKERLNFWREKRT